MASLASRLRISLQNGQRMKLSPCVLRPGLSKNRTVLVKATVEVAQVAGALTSADIASALSTVPLQDASKFLLEHPVATFSLSVAALFILPKLIEAFIRYLAAPVAIALLAFYVLEFPEDSAVIITTVLDCINSNPEVTSVVVIGLALFGLAPALLTALGATALVYALLSVSFGTQLPEVREMQGSFGETVTKVQIFSSIAAKRFEQLLK
ncbi:hypothetical protein VOLCADRAFT_104824 [Volvox carteri f. nagariensis]|uniref:Uncharacterized protein n=1 Tax=Volvox carteri f. nagariensis TaxID=3068 RepID=D8TWA6_VOLCA|nr:uncharacterized protein VOLCADRAFT_104824 [Volvox carteri f. nagariensis]EFJ48338.1 hypothetical protein VOLCADRAFT_104824 [Volvox carteri f. nagariensis]|eukprot:XP_002950592.1 hypothetical protein VOLCADRAFT_104824 [Volvox carteri f. nagariensis]